MKNSYLFDEFVTELVALHAVKNGQLRGNADTFMLIFSADTLDFAVAIKAKLEMEINFVKNGP